MTKKPTDIVSISTASPQDGNEASQRKGSLLGSSQFARALRHNIFSSVGLVLVFLFLIMALFPAAIATHDPIQLNLQDKLLPPSAEHWFGTDQLGMDVYSRVVFGARITLLVILVVLTIATSVGLVVGSLAGFLGGTVDQILMAITDIVLAFPSLILAITINALLGRGLVQTMLAVGFSWWPSYARLVRGQVLSVKNEEYVMAANAMGASTVHILTKHVLRNGFDPILVRITLDVGFVALTTAGLSFLGLGAEPPTPEWGRIVAEGRDFLLDQWWITTFPGLALFFVVVGFNLLGDLLRDWLDPSMIRR